MSKLIKTIFWIIIAIIIIILVMVGLNAKKSPVVEGETIKIGVLADLSGDYASLLRGAYQGTELAVDDLIADGKKVKLIIEDQKSCDAKETVSVMNKLINIDQVDFIVGGTCSNTTLAAAPIAEDSKTIIISPASSAPSISKAGEYVFRTYISDTLRAEKITKLVYQSGLKEMAIVVDVSNDATVELAKSSKGIFEKLGGNILAEEEITKNQTDFRTQIAKIKSKNPEVIFLSVSGPGQIGLFIKQSREIGLMSQFIVPAETAEDKQVINIAQNFANGLIYVMPGNPSETDNFQKLLVKYTEKYGEKEVPSYVAEAYDAVMLGVKAVLASDGTKEDIKNKLYAVSKEYDGVSGSVSFDENGDVDKNVVFKTIKNGQFVPYVME